MCERECVCVRERERVCMCVRECVCLYLCVCMVCLSTGTSASTQNADPVKRQRGAHVEREQPWEALFNFLILLQQPIQLFIQWCTSDVS